MPRFNISDYPRGYGVRDRDPESSMARGAQNAIARYARREAARRAYNEKRRKSNGGNGG